MAPDGVISPMAGVRPESVNQRFPFGPATISFGKLPGFRPCVYSVMTPDGVIMPMAGASELSSVNHKFPSGPWAIEPSALCALSPLRNWVTCPLGLTSPMAALPNSVNHASCPGPATTFPTVLFGPIPWYSAMVAAPLEAAANPGTNRTSAPPRIRPAARPLTSRRLGRWVVRMGHLTSDPCCGGAWPSGRTRDATAGVAACSPTRSQRILLPGNRDCPEHRASGARLQECVELRPAQKTASGLTGEAVPRRNTSGATT